MSGSIPPPSARRWLLVVTGAEAVGYLAPAMTGILTTLAGCTDAQRWPAMVASGFVEGLVLGAGQGWALPFPVRRLRFALLTAAGAGLVWAMVMSLMFVASGFAPWVSIAVGLPVGLVALGSIGTAQWLELRHHAPRATSWIAWTALAWCAALPLSFAPGPLVDESTPLAIQVVAWLCGGVAMALVMAAITWQGVRRLSGRRSGRSS